MEALLQSLTDLAVVAPPWAMLALIFLGGVVSSASPCVLAAVPLIVVAIGGTSTSRGRAFALSGFFALGLATTFTALGALAALSGRLLGDIGSVWQVLLGTVLIVMGLHLSGVIHLRLPQISGHRFKNAGLLGAFGLGALTGTLSSPCATPILVVVLSLVAYEQEVLWGTILLAAYSLGHVVLLFAAGAVSGFATAYLHSRAARWATYIHKGIGVALFGIGAWILISMLLSIA